MVLSVDNFHTVLKANNAHFMANPRFEPLHHDVTYPLSLR